MSAPWLRGSVSDCAALDDREHRPGELPRSPLERIVVGAGVGLAGIVVLCVMGTALGAALIRESLLRLFLADQARGLVTLCWMALGLLAGEALTG